MSHPGAAKYQHNEIFSMTPAQRVVFLYGQAVASLRQAQRFLEEGEIESRTRALRRAREIVGELLCSLDTAQGGELAVNLARLYGWIMDETVRIDRTADAPALLRITELVAELHLAWSQAAAMVAEPAAVAQ